MPTRFLIDENLGADVPEYLRAKGYNALSVDDAGLDLLSLLLNI